LVQVQVSLVEESLPMWGLREQRPEKTEHRVEKPSPFCGASGGKTESAFRAFPVCTLAVREKLADVDFGRRKGRKKGGASGGKTESVFFFLLPFFFSWVCTSAVFAAGELDLNHVLYPHESGVKVRNFRRDAILSFTVQSHRSLGGKKSCPCGPRGLHMEDFLSVWIFATVGVTASSFRRSTLEFFFNRNKKAEKQGGKNKRK
jgi:hypothetical protein